MGFFIHVFCLLWVLNGWRFGILGRRFCIWSLGVNAPCAVSGARRYKTALGIYLCETNDNICIYLLLLLEVGRELPGCNGPPGTRYRAIFTVRASSVEKSRCRVEGAERIYIYAVFAGFVATVAYFPPRSSPSSRPLPFRLLFWPL